MVDPVDLAKLAALLDPRLASEKPGLAVEKAHALLKAAADSLRSDDEEQALAASARLADQTVGMNYLPLPELFARFGGLTQYKDLRNFTEALAREGLIDCTMTSFDGPAEPKSSLAAVQELVHRQLDRKRTRDRARKAQVKSSKEKPLPKAEKIRLKSKA